MKINLELELNHHDTIYLQRDGNNEFTLRLYIAGDGYSSMSLCRAEVEKLKDMLEIILKG